eukprot:TRINITY_DN25321_c0_g1_i1.p1 TRINITY_DN25321_c0_g1~~TRINITY_DN25321_c0_g1_i1.p1  ORF type:complete len:627 (+),score=171.15 TRINITY_DN25321_c0_g1_i1:98-1978(+)
MLRARCLRHAPIRPRRAQRWASGAPGTPVWKRMAELARPEWGLVAAGAATLGVTSSVTLLLPYASGQVLDMAIAEAAGGAGDSAFSPVLVAAGLFGMTGVAGLGVFIRSVLLTRAGNAIVARLRRRLFAAVLSQEIAYHDGMKTGDFVSRLTADAALLQSALTTQAVGGLRGAVMSIGSAALLIHTSPTLAAISLCSLPPIFVAARVFGRRLKARNAKVQAMHAQATAVGDEAFRGIRTVRQFAAEHRELARYAAAIDAAHAGAVAAGRSQAAFDAVVHVAANGAVLAVLGYGGGMVLAGAITAGDLASFLLYSLLTAGNVSGLSSTYTEMMKASAAAGRIFIIIDRVPAMPSVLALPAPAALPGSEEAGAAAPLSVSFRDVRFSYPQRPDAEILRGLTLDVAAGEHVAIAGPSGGGKSTLAALLTRLYDVPLDSGEVRVDSTDIRTMAVTSLRSRIGVVAQEPTLFTGTIAENIRYGRPGASDADVRRAAKIAHVAAFADALPDGLGTAVGQGGAQLSGGQKQRVAIARMILRNPGIVVLDEATSALDAESERGVHAALGAALRGRTVLSIAHRLSTLRSADRVVVLRDGAVAEEGAFDTLVARPDGVFAQLMGRQITTVDAASA